MIHSPQLGWKTFKNEMTAFRRTIFGEILVPCMSLASSISGQRKQNYIDNE